jgi:phospholipid/cholesterol/gamma-HCH transport system substrate-binding protein
MLRINLFQSITNLQNATRKTSQLLADVQGMARDVEHGKGLAGYLLRDTITSGRLLETMTELQHASSNIHLSTDSLKVFIQQLNTQKGILNTVITDTIMAKNLKETVSNLNKGTAKFDENMEALKHNFLTRKYFKNLEKKKSEK